MAFLECRFFSDVLKKSVCMNAVIPADTVKKNRVIYLLHGLSDDASIWFRRTSIERYAEQYGFSVIMPDGGRSFYTDAVAGYKYWTFISEELQDTIQTLFGITSKRQNTFAAGLSMGGYGALKLALRSPDKFAAAAGLSSVTDIAGCFRTHDSVFLRNELEQIFGSPSLLTERKDDLFALAENCVKHLQHPPKIISFCGTEDFLISENRKFNDFMKSIQYPEFYSFERPGIHSWEFWDKYIQDVLKFFDSGILPEK